MQERNLLLQRWRFILNKEHNNEEDARFVAEKIKEVKLKEIASEINLDFGEKKIEIKIDKEGLKQTHSIL